MVLNFHLPTAMRSTPRRSIADQREHHDIQQHDLARPITLKRMHITRSDGSRHFPLHDTATTPVISDGKRLEKGRACHAFPLETNCHAPVRHAIPPAVPTDCETGGQPARTGTNTSRSHVGRCRPPVENRPHPSPGNECFHGAGRIRPGDLRRIPAPRQRRDRPSTRPITPNARPAKTAPIPAARTFTTCAARLTTTSGRPPGGSGNHRHPPRPLPATAGNRLPHGNSGRGPHRAGIPSGMGLVRHSVPRRDVVGSALR